MITQIKAGDKFTCIKDVVRPGKRKQPLYFSDQVYTSEADNCITNENGVIYNSWPQSDKPGEYFQRLDEEVQHDKFRENLELKESDDIQRAIMIGNEFIHDCRIKAIGGQL